MINRQQQPNEAPLPPVLEEQFTIPIFQIVRELKKVELKRVSLRTQDGFYISAVNGGGGLVVANAIKIGGKRDFSIIPQGANREKVAIQTSNGYYLSAIDGGGNRVDATATSIGTNELFTLQPVRPDQANFITAKGYFVLVLTTEPRLVTAYGVAVGPRTNIRIVPLV